MVYNYWEKQNHVVCLPLNLNFYILNHDANDATTGRPCNVGTSSKLEVNWMNSAGDSERDGREPKHLSF